MSITILHTRENEGDVSVFYTIDIDDEDYEFSADIPKGKNQQAWLSDNQDRMRMLILGKMYRAGDWVRYKTGDKSDLDAMKEWISKGHKNKLITGYKDEERKKPTYGFKVVEKREFRSTHPKYIKQLKAIESLPSNGKLKEILTSIVQG
ncbi:unnamed protein product [marine sediment metagenome]|uniref:Uncharacterized protein n=1 Tax=marine sediment metagenome TaxID=412755 RepID=X0UIG3_9ZZZZ